MVDIPPGFVIFLIAVQRGFSVVEYMLIFIPKNGENREFDHYPSVATLNNIEKEFTVVLQYSYKISFLVILIDIL